MMDYHYNHGELGQELLTRDIEELIEEKGDSYKDTDEYRDLIRKGRASYESHEAEMIDDEMKNRSLMPYYQFDNLTPALCISMMQMVIAIFTEVMNMLILTGQRSIIDVVTNYICLKIIADIDNIYASGLLDTILRKVSKEDPWQPKVVVGYVPFGDRSITNKILFILIKITKLLYNSLYFYFFPFLCIWLNHLSRRCTIITETDMNADGSYETQTICEGINVFYL